MQEGLRAKARLFSRLKKYKWGYIFIAPWLVGLLVFWIGPILSTFYFSTSEYAILHPPRFVGVQNYIRMFTEDLLFLKSVRVTFIYVGLRVPLTLTLGFLLAFALNRPLRGIGIYRAIVYLPAVLPIVAAGALWMLLLNPEIGWLNQWLGAVGLPKKHWLANEFCAKPILVVISLWQIGTYMVIFLSGLQDTPAQIYEAAAIDGAGSLTKLFRITIPMMTPTFLYALIIDIISSFQVFSLAFILTGGGPADSTLFYVLYLYRRAFSFLEMGYASAMSVLLFGIIMGLTLLILRSSRLWVHYERI